MFISDLHLGTPGCQAQALLASVFLIAACGLEWEDACLNFHTNTRKVETLSVFQVRQPINKGSVRAWERYGERLAPMIKRLRQDGMIKD